MIEGNGYGRLLQRWIAWGTTLMLRFRGIGSDLSKHQALDRLSVIVRSAPLFIVVFCLSQDFTKVLSYAEQYQLSSNYVQKCYFR